MSFLIDFEIHKHDKEIGVEPNCCTMAFNLDWIVDAIGVSMMNWIVNMALSFSCCIDYMNVVGNKILQFFEFFCVEMCCHIKLGLNMFHFEI